MVTQHVRTVLLLVSAALLLSGCENKNYKKCLADVDKYEKGKLECAAKTDATEREQCMDRNEVHKMTRADCDSSFK
ncbi:MAG: hypothetical protein R3B13_00920 [Polyangiaceae bacterium]